MDEEGGEKGYHWERMDKEDSIGKGWIRRKVQRNGFGLEKKAL